VNDGDAAFVWHYVSIMTATVIIIGRRVGIA
jgi:hypothetical protein